MTTPSPGVRSVYDALLRYEGKPGELKSLLATEVVGSPDATTWTIKLADNATFHDGSAVTAEAVQYNFQRMLRKNLGVAWMFATVMDQDSIEVVDRRRSTSTCSSHSRPMTRSSLVVRRESHDRAGARCRWR